MLWTLEEFGFGALFRKWIEVIYMLNQVIPTKTSHTHLRYTMKLDWEALFPHFCLQSWRKLWQLVLDPEDLVRPWNNFYSSTWHSATAVSLCRWYPLVLVNPKEIDTCITLTNQQFHLPLGFSINVSKYWGRIPANHSFPKSLQLLYISWNYSKKKKQMTFYGLTGGKKWPTIAKYRILENSPCLHGWDGCISSTISLSFPSNHVFHPFLSFLTVRLNHYALHMGL